jgi:hypothetical protein
MLSSRQRKIDSRSTVTQQARSGLVFASDHVRNELSASTSRIAPTVETYSKSRSDHRAAITDMLIDLRHYCDAKGLSFDEFDASACERYWDEKADLV